ncbi:MAG: serine hydrolase [Candidatus Eremiobacteraeota bacterium]|nr:serine hydrolase [Candidatus Eremiobacteraeota bacterium]
MRKISRITLLVSLILLLSFSIATADTVKTPAELKDLDSYIEKVMKDWKVPGLSIAIVKDGKIIYIKGFGYRDVKRKLKVAPDTVFPIGSVTKSFTALCVGLMVDDGKLEWNKPVISYLPDFRLKDPVATQESTPLDLLLHRTGMMGHPCMWYGADLTRREIYEKLRFLEFGGSFREEYLYSNLMYMTTGYLVGKVSGGTWEDFVRERIFSPLGMENSSLLIEEIKKSPDYSLPYCIKDGKAKEIQFRSFDEMGPCGSINSSANDMAKYLLLHINMGKVGQNRIISPESVKMLRTPQIIIESGSGGKIGDVFACPGLAALEYRGNRIITGTGSVDGFHSGISFMPGKKIGVVVLSSLDFTQNRLPNIITYRVFDKLLKLDPIDWNGRYLKAIGGKDYGKIKKTVKDDPARLKKTSPSHPIADYSGDFVNPGYGKISIRQKKKKLSGKFHSFIFDLHHYHYDTFLLISRDIVGSVNFTNLKLQYHADVHGDIDSLTINVGFPVKFERIPSPDLKMAEYLSKYVGDYMMAGNRITVRLENKSLWVDFPGRGKYEIEPVTRNRFRIKKAPDQRLRFNIDKSGNVTGGVIITAGGSLYFKKSGD